VRIRHPWCGRAIGINRVALRQRRQRQVQGVLLSGEVAVTGHLKAAVTRIGHSFNGRALVLVAIVFGQMGILNSAVTRVTHLFSHTGMDLGSKLIEVTACIPQQVLNSQWNTFEALSCGLNIIIELHISLKMQRSESQNLGDPYIHCCSALRAFTHTNTSAAMAMLHSKCSCPVTSPYILRSNFHRTLLSFLASLARPGTWLHCTEYVAILEATLHRGVLAARTFTFSPIDPITVSH
jgi:hypothetical protein